MASVLQMGGQFRETLQAGRLMGSFMTAHRTDLNRTETMTGKTDSRGRDGHRGDPYCEFGAEDHSLMNSQSFVVSMELWTVCGQSVDTFPIPLPLQLTGADNRPYEA